MTLRSIILLLTSFFLSCNGNNSEKETVELNLSLSELKKKKDALVQEQKSLENQISKIDSILNSKNDIDRFPLVTVIEMQYREFNHYIEFQGNVTTKQNMMIYPEMMGILNTIKVQEGDWVRKNQLLAMIDDGGMSNQMEQLKTKLLLAKTTYERQNRLWKQNVGSELQFLEAQSNYEIQNDAVKQFQKSLEKYKIKAPFDGYIDEIFKQQGTLVSPSGSGSEIFRIVNLSNMYIKVPVPETHIPNIKKGVWVEVFFPVLDKTLISRVSQISNFINPNNRSFELEVPVKNMNGMIKPNMTATVKINDYKNLKSLFLPQSIISENAEGERYVFVATNVNEKGIAVAKKVIVSIGNFQGKNVEILSGLFSGNLVISEGARTVLDGQKIRIVEGILK